VKATQLVAAAPLGNAFPSGLRLPAARKPTEGASLTQPSASAPQLFIPGLRPFYDAVAPFVYPLVRFAAGAVLVPHGCQKLLGLFGGGGLSGTMAGFDKMG